MGFLNFDDTGGEVWTVSELTGYIKEMFEIDFRFEESFLHRRHRHSWLCFRASVGNIVHSFAAGFTQFTDGRVRAGCLHTPEQAALHCRAIGRGAVADRIGSCSRQSQQAGKCD